jgi:NADPH2:quinone reductase
MKGIQINRYGGPEVLEYREVSDPKPGAGELLIKLEAIGVNFIDVYHRTGLYPIALPFIPGAEGAGIVEAAGADVQAFRTGDRVGYAMNLGSYAEKVVVPQQKLLKLPEEISSKEAAAILLQGMTVHYLSRSTYTIKSGDFVLIHAAAGGVGLMLVQAAKHFGAFVIGTVSTVEKSKIAKDAGADEIILYTEKDFLEETKRITGGRGVAVVYDSVGKTTFEKSLDCLQPRGLLVSFGQCSGPIGPFNPAILATKGSLFLTRPSLAHYIANRDELNWRSQELFAWVRERIVRIRIDSTYPLANAAEAHRRLESRASTGKILLLPN